jgi:Cu-Zn family superoxide dismutase
MQSMTSLCATTFRTMTLTLAMSVTLIGLAACGDSRPNNISAAPPAAPAPTNAVAILTPVAGHTGSGTIHFTVVPTGLHITADVSGFHPGKHGFHIHEYGDLTASDLSSLGGHFNPTGQVHGGPDSAHHHAGDLGNLVIGDDGQGHVDEVVANLSLSGDTSILGRSVVIHEGEDDMSSQPAGNSGMRIAAAVIGLAKP